MCLAGLLLHVNRAATADALLDGVMFQIVENLSDAVQAQAWLVHAKCALATGATRRCCKRLAACVATAQRLSNHVVVKEAYYLQVLARENVKFKCRE